MRKARVYPSVTKRIMRPEIEACLECHRLLRYFRVAVLGTIFTLGFGHHLPCPGGHRRDHC